MTGLARTARLDVLVEGYVRLPDVAGTVDLVRDADRVVTVDPGMVADRDPILRPLRELGVRPGDVADVVDSHHHLDHTLDTACGLDRPAPCRPSSVRPRSGWAVH